MQRKSTNQRKKVRGSIANSLDKRVEPNVILQISSRFDQPNYAIYGVMEGILLGALRGDNISDHVDKAIKLCTCKQSCDHHANISIKECFKALRKQAVSEEGNLICEVIAI